MSTITHKASRKTDQIKKKKMSRKAKRCTRILGTIGHHEMVSILSWATFRGVNNHYLFLHFLRTKLVVSLVPIIIWIKIGFGSKPANSKFIIGLEHRHLWRHLETMKRITYFKGTENISLFQTPIWLLWLELSIR